MLKVGVAAVIGLVVGLIVSFISDAYKEAPIAEFDFDVD